MWRHGGYWGLSPKAWGTCIHIDLSNKNFCVQGKPNPIMKTLCIYHLLIWNKIQNGYHLWCRVEYICLNYCLFIFFCEYHFTTEKDKCLTGGPDHCKGRAQYDRKHCHRNATTSQVDAWNQKGDRATSHALSMHTITVARYVLVERIGSQYC